MKIKKVILPVALTLASLTACNNNNPIESTSVTDVTEEKVTVSFETNVEEKIEALKGVPGDNLTMPTPKAEGKKFLGWYTDAALTNAFTGTKFPTENLKLYAKWDSVYANINYVYNNGQRNEEGKVDKENVILVTPELEGTKFAGWFTDKEFTKPFDKANFEAGMTVYAKYDALAGTAFVSTTGVNTNSGSMTEPIDILSAISRLNKTDETKLSRIYLFSGKYEFEKRIALTRDMSGKFNEKTIIAGLDPQNLVEFDFEHQNDGKQGVTIDSNFTEFKNIIVEHANTYGIYVSGSNNLVLNCVTRYNGNTGLGVGGNSKQTIATWPCNNLIKNCTSHDNYDYGNYGEDADGFSCKLTNGHNNVFDGCISFANSDDGFDLYAKNSSGNTGVTKIINCVAFRNGFMSDVENPHRRNDFTYNNGRTRNGDGNGFKLGGETMYDNVYVENCISFENGLNGFSDNSNPGVISVKNCTAFNNSLFEYGKSDNFNLARTTSSLNNYEGLLSIVTNENKDTDAEDDFRGPISNSIVLQNTANGLKYFAVKDVINGDSTKDKLSGKEIDLDPTSIFENVDLSSVYTQTEEFANSVHFNLRNPDGSVNLGNYLKVKNKDILTFNNGKAIGGDLSDSKDKYNHYESLEIANDASNDTVIASKIYDQIVIPCRADAVYENLDLYKQINGYDITWTSSNPNVVAIDMINKNAKDALKKTDTYFTGVVSNPYVDQDVTISASWTVGEVQMSKDFTVTVKALTPIIGEVTGLDDEVIFQGGEYSEDIRIFDLNGRSSTDNILLDDVTITKSYKYFVNGEYQDVRHINTNIPGQYQVIYTIKNNLADDSSVIVRNIEVINSKAKLEVRNTDINSFGIDITTSWKEGNLYTIIVPADAAKPTAEQVKAQDNYGDVTLVDKASMQVGELVNHIDFAKPTYGNYTVYIVAENTFGLSEVYSVEALKPTFISTPEQFYALSLRDVSNKEVVVLQNDIDFEGFRYALVCDDEDLVREDAVFSAYFNGNGHTIKNLTLHGDETYTDSAALFTNSKDAIFENVNFENCVVDANAAGQAGLIVAKASSSNFNNIKMKNITVIGNTNVGGLIGYANSGDVTINRVSLTNDSEHFIEGKTKHIGGLVGCLMGGPTEKDANTLALYDVYVQSKVITGKNGYGAGFVGRVKDNEARTLIIERAVFDGSVTGKYASTTVGGGDKNGLGSKWIFKNIITNITLERNDQNNGTLYGRIQKNAILGLEQANTYYIEVNAKPKKVKQNCDQQITASDLTEELCQSLFDLENVWQFSEGKITLR